MYVAYCTLDIALLNHGGHGYLLSLWEILKSSYASYLVDQYTYLSASGFIWGHRSKG